MRLPCTYPLSPITYHPLLCRMVSVCCLGFIRLSAKGKHSLKIIFHSLLIIVFAWTTRAVASSPSPLIPGHSLIIAVSGKTLSAQDRALLREIQPGGVILLGNNLGGKQQTLDLVVSIKRATNGEAWSGELPLIYVDQEGGRVNRMRLADAPSAGALGAKGDDKAVRETAAGYAREARERGLEVLIAPVLDLNVPGSRAVGDRAFSEDPEIAWLLGWRFMEGIFREGRLPVVKHFPGHGAATEDSHKQVARLLQTGAALEDTLLPFKNAVDAGAPAILVGHIACPALDPANPSTPATLSPVLVRGILREQWGYEGFILTDDMKMKAIEGNLAKAAIQSLRAGCDGLIICDNSPAPLRSVVQAIALEAEKDMQFRHMLMESRMRLDRFRSALDRIEIAPTSLQPDGGTNTFTHKVVKGDSLSKVAVRYGCTVEILREINNKSNDLIRIGEILHIPEN